jgi:hypothetical protein
MGQARGLARLLAGIRADGSTSATFPEVAASSGVSAAADDALDKRIVVRRTVAGAARLMPDRCSIRRSLPV